MAKGDMFLKLEGIEGESQDSKKTNQIEIDSFSLGGSNAGSFAAGQGGGTNRVNLQDMHFSKAIDKSSGNLFDALVTGKHITKAILTVRKAGGDEQKDYYTITMSPCLVSSYNVSGRNGAGLPSESFTLNFDKIIVDYRTQDDKGTLGAASPKGWHVTHNKPVTS